MTERVLNPQLRQVGYGQFLEKGLCPNSRLPCSKVGDLEVTLSASRDSLRMAGPSELPQYKATLDKMHEVSVEAHQQFDVALSDSDACLGRCALSAIES